MSTTGLSLPNDVTASQEQLAAQLVTDTQHDISLAQLQIASQQSEVQGLRFSLGQYEELLRSYERELGRSQRAAHTYAFLVHVAKVVEKVESRAFGAALTFAISVTVSAISALFLGLPAILGWSLILVGVLSGIAGAWSFILIPTSDAYLVLISNEKLRYGRVVEQIGRMRFTLDSASQRLQASICELEATRQSLQRLLRELERAKYQHSVAQFRNDMRRALKQCNCDALTGEEFEKFLKAIFEYLGYYVELTKRSNDQGADLILCRSNRRICVQAKRYQSTVGIDAIHEANSGAKIYGCERAVVITNSRFTAQARDAANKSDCLLIDGMDIDKLIDGQIDV